MKSRFQELDRLQDKLALLKEGLGGFYERYALNHFLANLVKGLNIRTVLEFPANGMMGVPGLKSLAFAIYGCEVTLFNPSDLAIKEMMSLWKALELKARFISAKDSTTDLKEKYYDLVWNFCATEHYKDIEDFISRLCRYSKRYILIQIQNIYSIGWMFHYIYHLIHSQRWDHGYLRYMDFLFIKKLLKANKFKIIEVGATDLPPWPDINMNIRGIEKVANFSNYGEEFRNLRPNVKFKDVSEVIKLWKAGSTEDRSRLNRFLKQWYHHIEVNIPKTIKRFIAHHPYVLGERE